MATHLLRSLIAHVITELTDMDVGFGKTRLVKLLYLIDVENYRRRRATISGLEWRFDSVYQDGLKRMAEEEDAYAALTGAIDISAFLFTPVSG